MRGHRVGVAQREDIFWRGVAALLADESGVEMVRVSSASEASSLDVAVVPAEMLGQRWPCSVVLCIVKPGAGTPTPLPEFVHAVLRRGAMTPEQLVGAVRAAAAGLRVHTNPGHVGEMDERKIDVLRMLATGASTRDISDELCFSERTIKNVISEIQHEFGARNRAHVVAEAMNRQLI